MENHDSFEKDEATIAARSRKYKKYETANLIRFIWKLFAKFPKKPYHLMLPPKSMSYQRERLIGI